MKKLHLIGSHQIQKDKEIYVKAKEIFGPQVKELHHFGSNSVKGLVSLRPSVLCCSGLAKSSNGEEWPHNNVWEENEHIFDNQARES